jgi:hypothetical protein
VKILIQHKETGCYLSRGKKWAKNPREALAFLDEIRAHDHCIYHRLAGASVVVVPDEGPVERAAEERPKARSAENENDIERRNMKPKVVRKSRSEKKIAVAAEIKVVAAKPAEATPSAPSLPKPVAKQAAPAEAAPARTIVAEPRPAEEKIVTTVVAKIDVGLGNTLFIRGQGDGLSWDRGTPLHCVDASTWLWATTGAREKVVFKLLLNDQVWSHGEDLTAESGKRLEVVPSFQ